MASLRESHKRRTMFVIFNRDMIPLYHKLHCTLSRRPSYLPALPHPKRSFRVLQACTLICLEVLRYRPVPGEVGRHCVLPELSQ